MRDDLNDSIAKTQTNIDKKKLGKRLKLTQEIKRELVVATKRKPERTRYCKWENFD